jgi:hypothetical protein
MSEDRNRDAMLLGAAILLLPKLKEVTGQSAI